MDDLGISKYTTSLTGAKFAILHRMTTIAILEETRPILSYRYLIHVLQDGTFQDMWFGSFPSSVPGNHNNTNLCANTLTRHPSSSSARPKRGDEAKSTGPHRKVAHQVPDQTCQLGDSREKRKNRAV